MRTKHLFYTAAMAALFAACVNDDFETIGQQENAVNDGRPVVGNVELNFTKGGGADTRLSYEGQEIGYQWEATDEIGALLMDNVVIDEPESEEWTWIQKYQLVDNIHTSYRFTYDANEKVWGCDAKMLEGNYFFAYPWESYDGERRVKHSLTNQTQEGVGAEIRRESYAKNQFFIGYSQIMAGTEDTEVLDSSVEMVPVLGAIQLQIVNTGTQTRHINKVVLKSNHLYSTLTFDPTNAEYETWNLNAKSMSSAELWGADGTEKFFNYANYTGNEVDTYTNKETSNKVYNITGKETKEYERNAALRAVVNQDPTETDNYAQITITGTPEQRALISTKTDEDAVAYVLIMANAVENVTADTEEGEDGGLLLDIYTDNGIVRNIDLTVKNTGEAGKPDKYGAITSSEIKAIGPSVVNTVKVTIDDNSFLTPDEMNIYTNDDLEQFIKWNVNETGAQTITAKLVKPNVTLSAEMAKLLADNSDVDLTITGNETLTLADGVVSNLLDLENVHINCGIKVEGTLDLTEDSELKDIAIAVAEGATLNINEDLDSEAKAAITNEGVVEIAEKATVPAAVTINNEAEMTIGADADVKGAITNGVNATIDNAGYIADLTNNAATDDKDEDGVVNLTGKSTIAAGTNNGIINAGKESRVMANVTNNGEIIMTELGAKISTGGVISYVTGDLKLDDTTLESLSEAKVNKLILTGDVTVANEKVAASFTTIAAQNGSSLEVGEKALGLTVTNLNIEGDATTDGTIAATNVTVNEDVTLTNYGAIIATEGVFTNNGKINNHGTVTYDYHAENVKGDFGYNQPNAKPEEDKTKQNAMNEAVKVWAGEWYNFLKTSQNTYYAGNPYDYSKFMAAVNTGGEGDWWNDLMDKLLDAGFTATELTTNAKAPAEFSNAVDAVLEPNADAFDKAVYENEKFNKTFGLQRGNWFADEDAVIDDMCAAMNSKSNIDDWFDGKAEVAAYAWYTGNKNNLFEDFLKTNPYIYVWKGSTVDQVVDLWKTATTGMGFTTTFTSGRSTGNDLVAWVKEVLGNSSADKPAWKTYQDELAELSVTILNASDLFNGYTADQIKACAENN